MWSKAEAPRVFIGPKLKLLAQVAGFAILSAHLRIQVKQLSVCCILPPIRKDRKKGNLKNIFVGNLSFNTSEDELRQAFEAYGQVDRVSILTDRETGRSRGFGFVEMSNSEEGEKAIAGLNGSQLGGRTINVNEARPKAERAGGGRERGGRR
jgi:cold-inducible RNA-binding protein